MAKYSTGRGGGGDDGGSCELCGKQSTRLRRANVAGASLLVCPDCAPHGENRNKDRKQGEARRGRDDGEPSRKKKAARRAARLYDAQKGDPTRWEEKGTNYEEDRLPYLVSGYGSVVERARREEGLTPGELAKDLGVDEEAVLAVEQGRATRAGVGGSVVRRLEERLDVTLAEG
ncbi:helix-turn-helix domain-containing protein [Halegenticoccus tardaugens]|uniref:helix-turn-helix domain-containing protein n=1 Tax=Halegenticoccus tardaugens TaxID=2071624 RepID=UPI00100A8192|nr:multiprotein-bridging factor 1 family protein [Halegenticoccus tardaugens]